MECAGICQSPLFYFSKSAYSGYPTKTCMTQMVEYVQAASGPLGFVSNFIGDILMLLLVMSFSLFGKTPPENEDTKNKYQGAEMQNYE